MKTCNNAAKASKQGGILLMAMLVMLTLSILTLGLFKLRETAVVEAVYLEHNKQAFWLAESGLADGEMVVQLKEYRDNPNTFTIPQGITNTVVEGYYDISIVRTIIDDDAGIYDFEVTSVGHVKGMNRRLQKTFTAFPGGKYAIIGISGHTDLAANVEVIGPIAQIEGTVNIHDSRGLDGHLIMGDGEGSLTDKKDEAVVVNLPPPPAPSIDASRYLDLLALTGTNNATTNITLTTSFVTGTNVYSTTGTVIFDSKVKIDKDAVLISAGNIRFNKSGVAIGEDVKIVSGNNISFKVQASVAGGVEIFAVNSIEFESGSSLLSTEPVLLMALNNDILMNANFDFRGIMIAENGKVELNANGDITGTVIGGVGVDADANISITYDETVFTEGTPVIPKSFGDVILTAATWQELPPL